MVVGADAWYQSTVVATATKGAASSTLTATVGTADGIDVKVNLTITTTEAPELSDASGNIIYIVNGAPYENSDKTKGVGTYTVAASFSSADKTIWTNSYAASSSAGTYSAVTKTLTLAAAAKKTGKVGAVLLAADANDGGDSVESHSIGISIDAVGEISITSGETGHFALRPASEDTSEAEASMPAGGYVDSYVSAGKTADQFFVITGIA